jgi:hypothetical protein
MPWPLQKKESERKELAFLFIMYEQIVLAGAVLRKHVRHSKN